jgi:hypothetical protein
VVDFAFFEFNGIFDDKREQIGRVEAGSEAYYLRLGEVGCSTWSGETAIPEGLIGHRRGGFSVVSHTHTD